MEQKENKEGSPSKNKLVCSPHEEKAAVEAEVEKYPEGEDVDIETSSEDSDSDEKLMCNVCHKKFSGLIPFVQHNKSGSHAKALKKMKMKMQLKKEIESDKNESDEDNKKFFVKQSFAVCDPCGKEFTGVESYVSHLASKNHKRKIIEASILEQVKEKDQINVDKLKEICKMKMTSEMRDGGISDTYKELMENIETNFASKGNGSEDEQEGFECKDCEKVFSGLIPFTQHLLSKIHHKKLKEKKYLERVKSGGLDKIGPSCKGANDISTLEVVDDVLTCKICSLSFSGPKNAFAHLKSQVHSKKHKLYTWRLSRIAELQDVSPIGSESEGEDTSTDVPNAILETQTKLRSKEGLNLTADENLPESADVTVTQKVEKEGSSVKETISTYQKYKEYKKIMNELQTENQK